MLLLQNYFSILKRMLCVACLVAIPLGSSALFADSIGINFASLNTTNPGAKVTGSAGVISQSNWNHYETNGDQATGTITTLLNDSGTTISGVDVSWTAPNAWRQNQRNDDGGNGSLMWGYLDSGNTPTGPAVTITGVPYSNYSVIIYSGPDGNRGGKFTIGGKTSSTVGSATSFTDNGGAFRAGIDYTVISGLTSSTLALTTTGRDAVSGLQIIEGDFAVPVVRVNRDTGNVSIVLGAGAFPITATGYTLASANGSLASGNWSKFAGTTSWVEASATAGDLSEITFDTSKAATLATNTTTDLGNVWTKSPYENNDITFEYLGTDGKINAIPVEFTGNGGKAYTRGDFNFDGNIDGQDWVKYVVGLGADLTGMSVVQAYNKGDLNNDLKNNHGDFLAFKTVYDAANGAGSFATMVSTTAVPEPSTMILLLMGGMFVFATRMKRTSRLKISPVLPAAVACLLAFSSIGNAKLVGHWEFEKSGNLGHATIGTDLAIVNPNSTLAASAGSGASDAGAVIAGPGDHLIMTHGLSASGGGTKTNQYSIMFDIKYPTASTASWKALLQTAESNAVDADVFLRPGNGRIGVGGFGYTPKGTVADTWYRVLLTVDNGVARNIYVDGQLWMNGSNGTIDDRFSLATTALILVDNNGEDATMNLSNLAIFDTALKPINASLLGSAGDAVAYINPEFTLQINKATGSVTMVNKSGTDLPQGINYYEISSGSGLLSTANWNSLADQNLDPVSGGDDPGETWSEGGGSSANKLTEAFLLGKTLFNDTNSKALGNVYTGGASGAEELTFSYALADGTMVEGLIEYVTGGSTIPGDTDGDGDVDATDLAAVGLNWDPSGANAPHPLLHGNFDGDTDVDASDLAAVGLNWNPAGGGSSLSTAAVPEPSSLILLAIGFVCLGFRKKM